MPYQVDQEVSVVVTTRDARVTPDTRLTNIQVLSLEHKISRIVVWNYSGEVGYDSNDSTLSKPVNVVVNNQTGPDGIVHDHDSYKTEVNDIAIVSSLFPICVDAYEEGDLGSEPPDAHRHGWFDENGNPVQAKGHPLNPGNIGDPNKKGFYPTISEHTGELKHPQQYER